MTLSGFIKDTFNDKISSSMYPGRVCYITVQKNLYLLYISAEAVTNERNTCSAFVFTKGFPTYATGGREIGGEPGRRHKGEKIK